MFLKASVKGLIINAKPGAQVARKEYPLCFVPEYKRETYSNPKDKKYGRDQNGMAANLLD